MSQNPFIRQVQTVFLVLRCQAGDEAAFSRLFDLFGPSTLRYLNGTVGLDLADDVQQDAWMIVLRKIRGLENPKRFKPWLYRIVRNAALDQLRKLRLEDRLFERTSESDEADHPAPDETPDLDWQAIEHAVSSLSPIHQEVIVLRYWEEFSYGEIALVTGIPIGSVRSRLHHAKAHLKQIFETQGDPYQGGTS